MGVLTTRRWIVKLDGESAHEQLDDLVVEAPLTIALDGVALATTMRTPGHDLELAAGWLVAESGVRRATDIVAMGAFNSDSSNAEEVDTVQVALASGVTPPEPRSFLTSSACGICSARLVAAVAAPSWPLQTPGWTIRVDVVMALPDRMRKHQRAFDRTGGVHAAAVSDQSGSVLVVREDVGRHNAVDKVIGHCLLSETRSIPLTDHLLVVSGRVSFEIVQKAIAASAAGIIAVSAPSSLAIDLARQHGLLVVGLARGSRLNVYSRPDLLGLDVGGRLQAIDEND